MRLWTVQTAAVWKHVQDGGQAWVDPLRVNPDGWVHPRYSWLAWQFRDRIDGSLGRLPWFAYCAKPDLRWIRHSRPAGEANVRIEFRPPPGQSVSFPCWAWHEVFCGRYLARSAAEWKTWDERVRAAVGVPFDDHDDPLPDHLQAETEASWRRLFDKDIPARSWRRGERRTDREAVVEVIRREWVTGVTEFVGTGTWGCGHLARPVTTRNGRVTRLVPTAGR